MTSNDPPTKRYARPRGANRVETLGLWAARLSLDADVLDISVGGLRLQLPFPPPIGAEYSITLALLGEAFDAPVVVRDVVRHEGAGGGFTFHVGLEFGALDASRRALVARFVDSRSHE